MRLYKRKDIFYIETGRGKAFSLHTTDEKEALRRFKVLEREAFLGRLIKLESENNITLGEFKKEYLQDRQVLSESTTAQDDLALRLLEDALGADTPLRTIDTGKIKQFVKMCLAGELKTQRKAAKPVSVNSYLRHIKSAFSTAFELKYISERPKIKLFPTPKLLPRFLKPEEIDRVLAKADELRPEFAKEMRFYLWTGARRNEVLNLDWTEVHLKGKKPFVILTGKGGKQRVVPILPELLKILKPMQKESGLVFEPVHEDTLSDWFREIADACDPPVKKRLHDLRHTAATYMLASGVPLEIVQEIMGHEDISTTQIYAQVVEEQVHKQMRKLKFKLE